MHLVILTQYFPPEIGAPQSRLSELAKRFADRGHRVTVLTAMPNYPEGRIHAGYRGLLRREQHGDVHVIRTFIHATNDLGTVRRLANYLSFVFAAMLFGTFLLPAADFVFVESPPLFLGIAGYWLSRSKRARLIFNVSDLWPDSVVRLGKLREGSASHRFSLWLERLCYRKAWMVTGQGRGILENISQRFPGVQCFLVSNGVDPAQFKRQRRSDVLRAELGGGRSCLAIYPGLHGLAQGLDQVLDAAAELRDLQDLMILFVGEGAAKAGLEQQARKLKLNNVRFLPPRPHGQMPELVASADIMIVPLCVHLPGAIPSKIYEAMGAEVPILLAADGEPAEIVERTDCGVVVPMGKPHALAQALRQLHDDPTLRRRLGAKGRGAAETVYNRDLIVARFIDRLEQELSPRSEESPSGAPTLPMIQR